MFGLGIAQEPWFGAPVGPLTHKVSRAEVDQDRAKILRKLATPRGWTGTYPYVVKIEGEGEYVVYADGTAQFWNIRQSRWEPAQFVDNQSMFYKMFSEE